MIKNFQLINGMSLITNYN